MKKSYICFLIVCTLLFSFSTVALAEEHDAPILIGRQDIAMVLNTTDHVHEFAYYEGQKPYKTSCKSNGSITHSLYSYYEGVCIHCSKEGTVVVIGAAEEHVFKYNGQNAHMKGESRHKYFYTCDACQETIYDIFLCGGTGQGDCIIMVPGAARGAVMEVE